MSDRLRIRIPLSRLLTEREDLQGVICLRTLGRWCKVGARGRKLASSLVGSRRMVSHLDLDTFLKSLNETDLAPSPRSPHERNAASAEAGQLLAAAGA